MTESNIGSGNISRMKHRPEVERRLAQSRFDSKKTVYRDGQFQPTTRRESLLARLRAVSRK